MSRLVGAFLNRRRHGSVAARVPPPSPGGGIGHVLGRLAARARGRNNRNGTSPAAPLGGGMAWRCALAMVCALQLLALQRAPRSWYPGRIELRLPVGASMVLGRAQLAAPHAARAHLELRRDGPRQWSVRALGQDTPVRVEWPDRTGRSGTLALVAGTRFALGGQHFVVSSASAGSLTWRTAEHSWQYDGAQLLRDGAAQPACPDAGPGQRLHAAWNRLAPRALAPMLPVTLGGNLHCGARLGIAGVEPASATIVRTRAGFSARASSGAGSALVVERIAAGQDTSIDAGMVPLSLDGARALDVGHTRLLIDATAEHLTLTPTGHVSLFTERAAAPPEPSAPTGRGVPERGASAPPPPGPVGWEWRARSAWTCPGTIGWAAAGIALLLVAAATIVAFQRGRWPFMRAVPATERAFAIAGPLLACAGLGALTLQLAGTPAGAGPAMLLGWCATWYVLLAPACDNLATRCGALLLAIGLLAQLELGLGGSDLAWLRHFQRSTALLAIGVGAGFHVVLRLRRASRPLPQVTLELMLAALAALALAALALQVVFGDETGVFDLQPVEFAKLALTALTAHGLAIGLGWHRAPSAGPRPATRWLRLIGPALVFLGLLGMALVQVDDYSPLVLLLVWLFAMVLAWALAARARAAAIGLVACALLAVVALAWLRAHGPAALHGLAFYGDRFQVWFAPAVHPHTGEQVLLAAHAIAAGNWLGSDGLLGLGSLGQAAGAVLQVPAVQDDFAPSFFINRHGLAGALGLWMLQALFVTGLAQAAARHQRASALARDFRQAWRSRFCAFVLCGGAGLVLGHFMLSWGTNLAIFPVMGQPMSFLSAGGSHLLFFICPLLAFSAISSQPFEETPSCQSMCSTKPWAA